MDDVRALGAVLFTQVWWKVLLVVLVALGLLAFIVHDQATCDQVNQCIGNVK